MKRIALATSEAYRSLPDDDCALIAPLAARGLAAEPAVWTDPAFPWSACDAVLLRSCWDYHLRAAEFLRWIGGLEQAGVRLWNPPALVRWNADKIYLRELQARGVAVIPTLWPEGQVDLQDEIRRAGWRRAVLKPRISATAHRTRLIAAADARDSQSVLEELQSGPGAMIQEFVDDVLTQGEWSLIFLRGEFSHAVVKQAKPGDFRVQNEFGGSITSAQPAVGLIETAARAVQAAASVPLYARVDGVESNRQFLLMELELIEPALYLTSTPAAADRFAEAIAAAIQSPS